MRIVRKFLGASTLGERQIRAVASDETLDRAGDIMVPSGCVLDAYRKNNIVLANHDPSQPIGTADVDVSASRLLATINFAPLGASAKADEFCALAKAGVLNAVSVGFSPISSTPIKGGGRRYTAWEFLEISIISVPANSNALIIERSARPTLAKSMTLLRGASPFTILIRAQRQLAYELRKRQDDLDLDLDRARVPIWDGNVRKFAAAMRRYLEDDASHRSALAYEKSPHVARAERQRDFERMASQ